MSAVKMTVQDSGASKANVIGDSAFGSDGNVQGYIEAGLGYIVPLKQLHQGSGSPKCGV
ncbi:MAG: hypothetical protein FWG10_12910 [Eubacteriaceae bacterium]|nr:hypothetical protein [Eubacteriaceae bacterium]